MVVYKKKKGKKKLCLNIGNEEQRKECLFDEFVNVKISK